MVALCCVGAREFRKSRSMFDVLDQRGRDGSQASSPRKICRQLSNNMNVVIFLAFVTVWVLFSDDLRFACMPARADPAMGWISIVCMCIFLLEIIMYSLASRSYVGSFFFWLDILATASMIFDIPAVEDAIFNLLNGDSTTLESAALARATRTSRVGTKAGRIASVRLPGFSVPLPYHSKLPHNWCGTRPYTSILALAYHAHSTSG